MIIKVSETNKKVIYIIPTISFIRKNTRRMNINNLCLFYTKWLLNYRDIFPSRNSRQIRRLVDAKKQTRDSNLVCRGVLGIDMLLSSLLSFQAISYMMSVLSSTFSRLIFVMVDWDKPTFLQILISHDQITKNLKASIVTFTSL